jgi:hypothetical protein
MTRIVKIGGVWYVVVQGGLLPLKPKETNVSS